jgi:SpoVK/Ycf46/Vps4 family AAA+-type ATPase
MSATDTPSHGSLFERTLELPDSEAQARLARMFGIDDKVRRLTNVLSILINPTGLKKWLSKNHPSADQLFISVTRRPPLIVLAGDVGSGKTELAETIGDRVARQEDINIILLPLSLSTRGKGHVGEMTQLLSSAFDSAYLQASKYKSGNGGKARGGVIMLVDEADALAQSRESEQMHHEDRAGVNAFIRGIDRLASGGVPAAVIMCTNRLDALDPAVRRRATDIIEFERPNEARRLDVLSHYLSPVGFTTAELKTLVAATGAHKTRDYGFTYSDLTQRLIPAIVLDAYPEATITAARAIELANEMPPTPPFCQVNRSGT